MRVDISIVVVVILLISLFACKGRVDYRNEAHRTVVYDTMIVYVPDTIKGVMRIMGHEYIDSLGRQHYTRAIFRHSPPTDSTGRINRIWQWP